MSSVRLAQLHQRVSRQEELASLAAAASDNPIPRCCAVPEPCGRPRLDSTDLTVFMSCDDDFPTQRDSLVRTLGILGQCK